MANLNYNKVIIGGRLTANPELKQTQSGILVTSFTVAVNRKPSKDGKQQADFFNATAWRNTAEFICKYFKKGASIMLTGKLQNREWKDNAGNNRISTEITVEEADFVDAKQDNSGGVYMPEAYKGVQLEEVSIEDDLPF